MYQIIKKKTVKYIDLLSNTTPLTNVYVFARSLIALSSFISLAFNDSHTLFKPTAIVDEVPLCVNEASFGFFCIARDFASLETMIILALIILSLVILGVYPRYTCLLHYWIASSITGNVSVIDGGDHVNTILTLLLIPICLFDNRKFAYKNAIQNEPGRNWDSIKNIFLWTNFGIIAFQVASIYLHASLGKLEVEEWRNGTAVYYFFTSPALGMPEYLKFLFLPLINNSITVSIVTYGTLIFEFILFCSLFMNRYLKLLLFPIAVAFHFMIILLHGLPSFFLAMSGALVLLMWPKDLNLKNIFKVYFKNRDVYS